MAAAVPDAGRPGARLRPGTVLADRYRLESILGAGTFGVVWRARHVHLETECAVKLFDPPPEAEPREASGRFLQEARLTARLKSPHVAQVFDYGVQERMPFLVLELLQGKSLAGYLAELRERGQALGSAETARVIRHVAEALHVAHAARVVHRDLKPDNIFLVEEGESYVAKVLDFGIAKWSTDASPGLTTTRTVMGTPHYMSAEQFESARQVDHRADLWSLGVIAFECMTGQVPFPGDTLIDVAFRVCKEGPLVASQIADVPEGFDAWFARATALGREYRFESALEQARALERVCASAPQRVALASPPPVLVDSGATPPALVGPARAVLQSLLGRRAVAVSQTILQRALGSRRRRWLSVAAASGGVLLWIALAFRSNGVAPPAAPGTARPEQATGQPHAVRDAPGTAAVQPEVVIESANPLPSSPAVVTAPAVPPAADPPSNGSPQSSGAVAVAARATSVQTANARPTKPASTEVKKSSPAGSPPAARQVLRTSGPEVPASKRAAASSAAAAAPVPAPASTGAGKLEARPETQSVPTSSAVNDAAAAALGNAARLASSCRPRGGPSGPGKARIIYSNDGEVQSVEILTGKFRDTLTGSCLRMVFRRAKIPPFKGEPPTFIKSFAIPEG